jgi:tetratricopeptide (TPR) repeat protein
MPVDLGIDTGSNLVEHYFNRGGIYSMLAAKAEGIEERLSLYQKAEEAYKNALAAPLFCRGGAVDIDTGSIKPLSNLATIYISLEQWNEARKVLLQLLSIRDIPYARQQLATVYTKLGDKPAALRQFKLLNDTIANDVDSRSKEAEKLLQSGDMEKALQLFEQIYRDYPLSFPALYNYAMAQLGAGKLEEAEQSLIRACGIGDNPESAYQLARCLRLRGKNLSAISVADACLAINPTFGPAHYEMGYACHNLGIPELSLKEMQYSATLGFSPPEMLVLMSKSHAKLGNIEQSLEIARRAQEVDVRCTPELVDIYNSVIETF